jgi:hypothetical protein
MQEILEARAKPFRSIVFEGTFFFTLFLDVVRSSPILVYAWGQPT